MKNKSLTTIILASLLTVSVFAVGFSSWSIGDFINSDKSEVSFETGVANDAIDCIEFTGYEPLEYSETGFVPELADDQEILSDPDAIGTLKINLTFNMFNIKDKFLGFEANDNINFICKLTLSNGNSTLFEYVESTLEIGLQHIKYTCVREGNDIISTSNIVNSAFFDEEFYSAQIIFKFKPRPTRWEEIKTMLDSPEFKINAYATLGV